MNFIVQLLTWLGVQCELKRGTKRIVLVFSELGFALKFPIFQPYYFFKFLWIHRKNLKMFKLLMWTTSGRTMLVPGNLIGFRENLREYRFFQNNQTQPFLFPVHFSLFGICNVMPIKGDLPSTVNIYINFLGVLTCRTIDIILVMEKIFVSMTDICV